MKLNWEILLKDSGRFPRTLFFEIQGTEKFRYGVNELLQHCLYFQFPPTTNTRPLDPLIMTNLSLVEEIVEGNPTLVLTLLNESSKNLFSDLIISLVDQSKNETSNSAKARFISLCNEWFELFDPLFSTLNRLELQCIAAELSFLRFLLENSSSPYNYILSAWKGPFGKAHDFELANNHFEIKSKTENFPNVHISSEYQLDFFSDEQLLLVVYEFNIDYSNGFTIHALIQDIVLILRSNTGTSMKLFWAALSKAGLKESEIEQYNSYTFNISKVSYYTCNNEVFPSLRSSRLPEAIRNLKYDLNLNQIQDYLIYDITPFI